jgi:hypothetical protein
MDSTDSLKAHHCQDIEINAITAEATVSDGGMCEMRLLLAISIWSNPYSSVSTVPFISAN